MKQNLSLPNLAACSGNGVRAATWSPLVCLEPENKAWKQIQQLLPRLSTGSPETSSKTGHGINAGFYLICVVSHVIHGKFSANTELRTENMFFWVSGFSRNYSHCLSALVLCLKEGVNEICGFQANPVRMVISGNVTWLPAAKEINLSRLQISA